MAEFISLADARQAMKGNFIATVVGVGDLKSGTKDNKDWTYKKLTLEDTSGKITLTVWGGEIKLFEYGKTYEFHTPWFTNYEGEAVLALGKYCQVKLVENPVVPDTTPTQEPTPEPAVGRPPKAGTKSIPEMDATHAQTVRANTLLMIQIEKEVKAVLKDMSGEEPRGDKVGMYTRMNFYFLKGMDAQD